MNTLKYLWDELENFDFDENDFHEVSSLLKKNKGLRTLIFLLY